jgi:hypothetical protein
MNRYEKNTSNFLVQEKELLLVTIWSGNTKRAVAQEGN